MKMSMIYLVPLEYPYQVTQMRKLQKDLEIKYTIRDCACPEENDVYILIVKEVNDEIIRWMDFMRIDRKKVIFFAPERNSEDVYWCMPKAFEKEFDAEKLMTYLGCILKENPEICLFQNLDLKMVKINKDPTMKVNLDSFVKENLEVHFFIKDKTRRILQVETNRKEMRVHQHWIKGIESEIDVLMIKRKS